MENVKTIPELGKEQLSSLARIIVEKNLVATPEQCAAFYATPAGQRMKARLDEIRKQGKKQAV